MNDKAGFTEECKQKACARGSANRVIIDPLKYVGQPLVRIDVVDLAGTKEAVEDGCSLGLIIIQLILPFFNGLSGKDLQFDFLDNRNPAGKIV